MKYSLDRQYAAYVVNSTKGGSMIEVRIDQLLKTRGRTFYWLAKETGISHTTLWRLKKGKSLGINFITLEKLCERLDCQPGDVFAFISQKRQRTTKRPRIHAAGGSVSR
jgi:putative transcriptional regulator